MKSKKDRESVVTVYKSDDYSGPLNLLASEKILILKAAIRFNSHRLLMSKELEISVRHLYRLITSHGLDGCLEADAANKILVQMKKEYPLIVVNTKQF